MANLGTRSNTCMSNKSSTITSTEVRELLKNAAKQLSAREEKALRMRNGASVDMQTPLPRRGQDNPEAKAELLALEIELKQKLAARSPAKAKAPLPVKTKEKDKIIRALRRLK
jgi:hypothetical protein